jgi:Protein of unknown function (DUF4254)
MNFTTDDLIEFSRNIQSRYDALLSSSDWPQPVSKSDSTLIGLADAIHFFNTSLWNEEDLARRRMVSDSEIAKNKRAIDQFNQNRNDQIERLDDLILSGFKTDTATLQGAYRSSETAGSMVDRISILSLKIHHMKLQTRRSDVDEDHRIKAISRLEKLFEQRVDLTQSLQTLLTGMSKGTAYYKIYRQFKMYNDPNFNPALVSERAQTSGS